MTINSAFTQFPTLTSHRLVLRQMQPTDADAFFAIKSDAEVTTPYGQEPHQSIADTQAWMSRHRGYYERCEALFWCITLKGEDTVIGSCTFWNFDPGFHSAEIGYELHRAFWQQGIMTEAVACALSYGFRELALHRVEAVILAENMASKRLLRKLGFMYEGALRQRCFFRGEYHDQLYFGILSDDWLKAR